MFNGPVGTFRYKAFISYSHQDRTWGAWLQRALEKYRIPRRLVGSKGAYGKIPARLSPVFRDREDLSSASDLDSKVKEELGASESMLVICSPTAARSCWVNEEVRYFIGLGRGDRIFALIVDGDPQADDPDQQCFPVALTVNPDGTPREPLAADVRKWADGRLLAKLKIISGILGIRLDDLRRRDMQRRHRLWMVSTGGAMAIAVMTTVLAVMAVTARNAAENRREHAENLVGYMVGDLKTKLDEVGRLDILEGVGGRVSEYLQTLNPDEVTDESLDQQAQVWRQLGEVGMDQGELPEALKAFSASRDILAELYRRKPNDPSRLYELGNAEFWVAYVHLKTGEFDQASEGLEKYLDYAIRLNELEPNQPEWLIETSYAHSNLATLIIRRGDGNVDQAVSHIKAAVEINRLVMELDPDNPVYLSEYGEVMADLADTQLLACDLGDAVLARRENVAITRKQMEQAQGNVNLKSRYAFSLAGLSSVAEQVGLVDLAIENFSKSKEILGQLSSMELSNLDFRFAWLRREFDIANLLAETGQLKEAIVRMASISEPQRQVLEAESYGNMRRYIRWISYLLTYSDMKWRAGDQEGAEHLLTEAIRHLEILLGDDSDREFFMDQLMTARFLYWQQTGQDLLSHDTFAGIEIGLDSSGKSCQAQAILVGQAILQNETEVAEKFTAQLLTKGYYEPGFIRVCRQYQLCQGGG